MPPPDGGRFITPATECGACCGFAPGSGGRHPKSRRKDAAQRPLRLEQLESRTLMAVTVTPSAVPALSSRPAAPASLYLDFNGNVEKQWGSHTNVVTPPYDTDGNPASFSAGELAAIRESGARAAEVMRRSIST